LLPKLKIFSVRVRSWRESNGVKKKGPMGTDREVIYQQPIPQPSPRSPVQPSIHAIKSCSACGQPVPKDFEKEPYCAFCGKAITRAESDKVSNRE
jgi:hypothetical protein